jgi:hypothetical protein
LRSFSLRQYQDSDGLLAKALKHARTLAALVILVLFVAFPLLFSNPAVTSIAVFVLIFPWGKPPFMALARTSWR